MSKHHCQQTNHSAHSSSSRSDSSPPYSTAAVSEAATLSKSAFSTPAPSVASVTSISTPASSSDAKRHAAFDKRFQCDQITDTKVLSMFSLLFVLIPLLIQTEKQMAAWKSKVYEHFKMPPTVVRDDVGNIHYRYTCLSYVFLSHNLSITTHFLVLEQPALDYYCESLP